MLSPLKHWVPFPVLTLSQEARFTAPCFWSAFQAVLSEISLLGKEESGVPKTLAVTQTAGADVPDEFQRLC